MGALKKLNRELRKEEKKKAEYMEGEKRFEEEAKQHPAYVHICELRKAIEKIHFENPTFATKYINQIKAISSEFKEKSVKLFEERDYILKQALAKIDADYKEKEIWLLMNHIEREHLELLEIIKLEKGDGEDIENKESEARSEQDTGE